MLFGAYQRSLIQIITIREWSTIYQSSAISHIASKRQACRAHHQGSANTVANVWKKGRPPRPWSVLECANVFDSLPWKTGTPQAGTRGHRSQCHPLQLYPMQAAASFSSDGLQSAPILAYLGSFWCTKLRTRHPMLSQQPGADGQDALQWRWQWNIPNRLDLTQLGKNLHELPIDPVAHAWTSRDSQGNRYWNLSALISW